MDIRPGDIFWISPDGPSAIASDFTHPHVVVQVGAPGTVLVCALTSNLRRLQEPGNMLLEEGEAGLPRRSVVLASRTLTVDARQLGAYIGTLAEARTVQVLAGLRLLESMTQHHG